MNKKSNKIINDLVIEAANDGIIAVDQNGKIVLFNKAASLMTGISQKQR
ncbi:PAS domain-containing protein [Sinobaca sp. H24]|nr:PAS domain-containing protein [Sinobaca sp. H24]